MYPAIASATWPFTRAEADTDAPVVHDPSMRLLAADVAMSGSTMAASASVFAADGSALMPGQSLARSIPEGGALTSGGDISQYTIKDGDTLSSIASRFGISVNTLLWANDLTTTSVVKPGMELVILPVSGISHTVKSGDTLSSIARQYSANQSDIAAFNGISDENLKIGDKIIVPGGERAAVKAKESTKKPTAKGSSASAATRSSGGSGSSGMFRHPVPGALLTQNIHGWNGVDFGAPSGTAVYAAAGGTVTVAKSGGYNGGYGSYVVISHGNGVQTLYAHLSSVSLSAGDTVSAGDRVGAVGNSGISTGFHLHFEVRGARNPFAGCAVMSRCSI